MLRDDNSLTWRQGSDSLPSRARAWVACHKSWARVGRGVFAGGSVTRRDRPPVLNWESSAVLNGRSPWRFAGGREPGEKIACGRSAAISLLVRVYKPCRVWERVRDRDPSIRIPFHSRRMALTMRREGAQGSGLNRKAHHFYVIAGYPIIHIRAKTDLPCHHCSDNVARKTPQAGLGRHSHLTAEPRPHAFKIARADSRHSRLEPCRPAANARMSKGKEWSRRS